MSSAQRKSEASNTLPFSSLWTLLGIWHSPRGMEELPLIVGAVASEPAPDSVDTQDLMERVSNVGE